MQTPGLSRIGIAVAVAVTSIAALTLLLAAAPATGGPAALTPDLVTLAFQQKNLFVERRGSKTLLRLSNEIGNDGAGPLEVYPSPASQNCDGDADPANDRDASQRLFADSNGSGAYESGDDAIDSEQGFGCMRYHPAHNHWHVLDIARYELRRESTGKLVSQSRKVGFCLTDTRLALPSAASPAAPVYPIGSAAPVGCDATSVQGLSPGWADLYEFAVPGQQLSIGGLRHGQYCLTSHADPLDLLEESDELNNVRRVRVALRPRRLSVRKLEGACRT